MVERHLAKVEIGVRFPVSAQSFRVIAPARTGTPGKPTVFPFLPARETPVSRPLPVRIRALAMHFVSLLPPGFEPGTTVPKTVVISVSPRERQTHTGYTITR